MDHSAAHNIVIAPSQKSSFATHRSAWRRPCFKHSPLNHQTPSIRLIKIGPELSQEGYIQCTVEHTLINGTYICLSYVWGETDAGHWIFLNGQRFWIRNNLWAFLNSARQKLHIRSEWLWIDALCIDQANNAERTHQVQQMGRIFGSAYKVISWLGPDKKIGAFLKNIADSSNTISYRDISDSSNAHIRFNRDLYNSVYWDRAWITQEIALARRNTFMATDNEAKRESIPVWKDMSIHPASRQARIDLENTYDLRGRSLIYLLDTFKSKSCSVMRDRVFSLLALCGDGSDVKVDYESPHGILAKNILRSCQESFCFCSVRILQYVLQLRPSEIASGPGSAEQTFARITLPTVAHTVPGWWLTPKVAYSRTQIVSGVDSEEFTIDLKHICDRSSGRVAFSTNFATKSFTYRHIKQRGDLQSYGARHRAHGCTFEVSDDAPVCIVGFSFDLLVRLAMASNKASEPICCHRVADCGTGFAEPSAKRVLQLCPY